MRISDWSSDVCSSYLTALGDVAGRQFLALAVDDGRGPREEAVRVGREAATDPADQTGEECLHRQTAFAAHHPATDTGLPADRDEALDLDFGIAATRLRAGHLGDLPNTGRASCRKRGVQNVKIS